MRALVALTLLLVVPTAGASFLHRDTDPSGDVTILHPDAPQPATLPGVDLVAVDAQRWEGELLVVTRFADEMPEDIEVTVTYRIGPEEDMVGIMRFSRSEGAQPQVVAFFSNRAGREPEPVRSGAIVGTDAIQFVFEERLLDGLPCFALQAVSVVHVSDEFDIFEDGLALDPRCPAAESRDTLPSPRTTASTVAPVATNEDAAARDPRDTPLPALVCMAALVCATLLARRR